MSFNDDEGEYYGLRIIMVPYSKGQKIIWQSGSGRLQNPLLLDITDTGNGLTVAVPNESEDFGIWKLYFNKKVLRAVGPRGLTYDLNCRNDSNS